MQTIGPATQFIDLLQKLSIFIMDNEAAVHLESLFWYDCSHDAATFTKKTEKTSLLSVYLAVLSEGRGTPCTGCEPINQLHSRSHVETV